MRVSISLVRRSVRCGRLLIGLAVLGLGSGPAAAQQLDRGYEPVVVQGAQVPGLVGKPIDSIRGYRWTGGPTGQFVQIRLQVDERVYREITGLVTYPGTPVDRDGRVRADSYVLVTESWKFGNGSFGRDSFVRERPPTIGGCP